MKLPQISRQFIMNELSHEINKFTSSQVPCLVAIMPFITRMLQSHAFVTATQ